MADDQQIVLTNADGEQRGFPADQVVQAYQSGQWTAPADLPIPVAHANGEVSTVPFGSLLDAHAQGAVPISQKTYDGYQLQQQYGDLASQAENAATQALSGASLGTSDMLLGALASDETREGIRKREEANPIGSAVAKIGGALVPIALSGGAAAPEEAAGLTAGGAARAALTAPTELLSRAGSLAERGVSALLPEEASSVAGQLAIKAAATGARGAAEGGAIGGLNYLGETALSQDQDFDAEKLRAAVGHGVLLGGLAGAGLGAAGVVGGKVLDRAAPRLQAAAEEQATKVLTGGSSSAEEALEALPGGSKAVSRVLLDDGLIGHAETVADVAPRLQQAAAEQEGRVSAFRAKWDADGIEGPSVASLRSVPELAPELERLGVGAPAKGIDEVLHAIRTTPEGAATLKDFLQSKSAREAGEVLEGLGQKRPTIPDELMSKFGPGAGDRITFADAQDLRAKLDALSAANPKLLKARGALDEEITAASDKAQKALDPEDLRRFQAASLKGQQLSAAASVAAKSAQEAATARPDFSLAKLALFGANPAHAAAAMATQAAHKVLRDRGASTAAVVMDRLSAMSRIQRATATVDQRVSQGVEAAMGARAPVGRPMPHGYGDFASKSDAVLAASANVADHAASVSQSVSGLAPHAPTTVSAFVDGAVRATQYLASILPRDKPSNPLMPHVNPIEPSEHEKAVFSRAFEAVHDPVGVLVDIRTGTLVPEQVKAIEATAPKLKAQMDAELKQAMLSATEPLEFPQAISMSMFLGEPTDPTLEPQAVAASQSNFLQPTKGPPGAPPKKTAPKADKLKLSEQTSLETSKV